MEELKVLSLFSGIGAFEKALTNLKISFELVGYSEIDKHASKAYSLIHGVSEELNLGDIKTINVSDIPEYDLLVGGSPCTNISVSGNQKGLTGEESKLFFDYTRILNHTKPKYFVFENVKNLISTNDGKDFEIVKRELGKNYNITYSIINSKIFIPQVRERLFVVGIRKDLKGEFDFNLPDNKTDKTFYDYLESEDSISSEYYKRDYYQTKDKYKSFTYTKNTIVKLVDNKEKPTTRNDGNIYTLTKSGRNCGNNQYICSLGRVLTLKECFRLMGFDDQDFNKINGIVKKTHLYGQAGNSIVVNVLEHIFKNLFL